MTMSILPKPNIVNKGEIFSMIQRLLTEQESSRLLAKLIL